MSLMDEKSCFDKGNFVLTDMSYVQYSVVQLARSTVNIALITKCIFVLYMNMIDERISFGRVSFCLNSESMDKIIFKNSVISTILGLLLAN